MKYTSIVQKRAIEAAIEQGMNALEEAMQFFPDSNDFRDAGEIFLRNGARIALSECEKAAKALETILKNLD